MALSRPAKAMILASGNFLTAVVNLVSVAVLSRVLDKADYGTYRQALLTYFAVVPFFAMGLPQALYFFLPGVVTGSRRILVENLSILFATGGMFAAFLLFGGDEFLARLFDNPTLIVAFAVFWAYPLVAVPLTALPPCLMARDRPRIVAIFNLGSRILILGLVLAAALWFRAPGPALAAMVAGTAVSLVVGLVLMLRSCPHPPRVPSVRGILSQLRFGIPLGLAGTVGVLTGKVGQIIVGKYCSVEQFAEYSNGAVELPMIGIITGSVIAVITPEMAAGVKGGRIEEVLRLWRNAMVKCSALLLPIMVGAFVLAPEFIRVVFSAEYDRSVIPFRWLLLLLPIRSTNFGAFYLAANRNELVFVRTLASLVASAGLGVVFVQWLGAWGAAIAMVIATYAVTIPLNLFFLSRITKVSPFRILPVGRVGRILAASVAAGVPVWGVLYLVPTWPDLVRLAVGGASYALAFAVVFHVAGITEHLAVLRALVQRRRTTDPPCSEPRDR